MKLKLSVDGLYHEIDSTDPELLSRWIIEIFIRTGPWTPATYAQLQALPSWVPTEDGRGRPDWIADSRVISNLSIVHSPQEIVDALQKQIKDAADLEADDAIRRT